MKKILRSFNLLIREEGGAVAILVAASMVVLFGFSALVMDMGVAYKETGKMQTALDSAALAGVRELPANDTGSAAWQSAVDEAEHYALANGLSAVTCDAVYNDDASKIVGIRVNGTRDVNYTFARILGLNQVAVNRLATAELETADSAIGCVPLCATDQTMNSVLANPTQIIAIKVGSASDDEFFTESGWFGALALLNPGGNVYRENLSIGYRGTLTYGQVLNMQTGVITGPTSQGYSERIIGHTACTYENHEPDCPRVVVVPIVQILPKKQVEIIGFASFFVIEYTEEGGHSVLNSKYIPGTITTGSHSDGSATDYGVYISRLTE